MACLELWVARGRWREHLSSKPKSPISTRQHGASVSVSRGGNQPQGSQIRPSNRPGPWDTRLVLPPLTTFPHCKLSPAYQRFGCSFLRRRLFNLVPPCNNMCMCMLWLVLLAFSLFSLADDSPTPLAKALSLQGCLRRSDATCVLTPHREGRRDQAAS